MLPDHIYSKSTPVKVMALAARQQAIALANVGLDLCTIWRR